MERKTINRRDEAIKYMMQFINKKDPKTTYMQLATFLKTKSFSSIEEFEQMRKALEGCYNLLLKPGVLKEIVEKNMSARDVVNKYFEDILGDSKRKYDMSKMYDETIIASQIGEFGERKKIVYKDRDGEPCDHEFTDKNGRKVIIEPVGDLAYENALKTRNYLNKYIIKKQLSNGTCQVHEVFSIIDIFQMDNDEEYKNAVIEELLSDNNMELSNAGGYIGTIVHAKEAVGTEQVGELAYNYQVNRNYGIEYNADDLSAVVAYELGLNEIQPKINNGKNESEDHAR